MLSDIIAAGPYGAIGFVFFYFVHRLNRVEARLDKAEQDNLHLHRLVGALRAAYRGVRRTLLDVADDLDGHGAISPERRRFIRETPTLEEVEAEATVSIIVPPHASTQQVTN